LLSLFPFEQGAHQIYRCVLWGKRWRASTSAAAMNGGTGAYLLFGRGNTGRCVDRGHCHPNCVADIEVVDRVCECLREPIRVVDNLQSRPILRESIPEWASTLRNSCLQRTGLATGANIRIQCDCNRSHTDSFSRNLGAAGGISNGSGKGRRSGNWDSCESMAIIGRWTKRKPARIECERNRISKVRATQFQIDCASASGTAWCRIAVKGDRASALNADRLVPALGGDDPVGSAGS